jgi:hypothetical protein
MFGGCSVAIQAELYDGDIGGGMHMPHDRPRSMVKAPVRVRRDVVAEERLNSSPIRASRARNIEFGTPHLENRRSRE